MIQEWLGMLQYKLGKCTKKPEAKDSVDSLEGWGRIKMNLQWLVPPQTFAFLEDKTLKFCL